MSNYIRIIDYSPGFVQPGSHRRFRGVPGADGRQPEGRSVIITVFADRAACVRREFAFRGARAGDEEGESDGHKRQAV
jgi:hypothetical protein